MYHPNIQKLVTSLIPILNREKDEKNTTYEFYLKVIATLHIFQLNKCYYLKTQLPSHRAELREGRVLGGYRQRVQQARDRQGGDGAAPRDR